MHPSPPTTDRRPLLLLAAAVLLVAAAMAAAFTLQRREAVRAADRTATAVSALTAMLDQETGVRGFIQTARPDFLEPFYAGQREFAVATADAREASRGDARSEALLRAQVDYAGRWHTLAAVAIREVRAQGRGQVSIAAALQRKGLMDAFRASNAAFQQRLGQRRDAELAHAGEATTGAVLLLTITLGAAGFALIRRGRRQRQSSADEELGYRRRQREFTEVIQVVGAEDEAHVLVKRHLERSAGVEATVLHRSATGKRLEAGTPVAPDSPLAQALVGADPGACVAIRLARPHTGRPGEEALLPCELCGGRPGTTTCQPLMVGGKVIGSVLVEHDGELGTRAERHLTDTVAQAGPVLANLRTIAIAEERASTDALTGLANRRAAQETLTRMVAQAGRAISPLAAIGLDLDRFKTVNDSYGHDVGDRVLVAVAEALRSTVRESDFVGRMGGEEFLVLAPDTGHEGAAALAEKLRAAVAALQIPGLPDGLTTSLGVAVLPDDAGSAGSLTRAADRALYRAKEHGRDRVEVAPRGHRD